MSLSKLTQDYDTLDDIHRKAVGAAERIENPVVGRKLMNVAADIDGIANTLGEGIVELLKRNRRLRDDARSKWRLEAVASGSAALCLQHPGIESDADDADAGFLNDFQSDAEESPDAKDDDDADDGSESSDDDTNDDDDDSESSDDSDSSSVLAAPSDYKKRRFDGRMPTFSKKNKYSKQILCTRCNSTEHRSTAWICRKRKLTSAERQSNIEWYGLHVVNGNDGERGACVRRGVKSGQEARSTLRSVYFGKEVLMKKFATLSAAQTFALTGKMA